MRVAFAADGKPTKALEGFARTNGVSVDDVYRITTEKGEYVAVRKRIGGAAVADLLAEICPAVITSLPFGKRMRWGSNTLAYARPLRWIVALLDDAVVPFTVGPWLPVARPWATASTVMVPSAWPMPMSCWPCWLTRAA